MVLLWDATESQAAPFYLYACNLAKIKGLQRLVTGFQRLVYGSTDVTGPNTNWRVEWESESGMLTPEDVSHAETNVFDRPGQMKLELPWPPTWYTVAVKNAIAAAQAAAVLKSLKEAFKPPEAKAPDAATTFHAEAATWRVDKAGFVPSGQHRANVRVKVEDLDPEIQEEYMFKKH